MRAQEAIEVLSITNIDLAGEGGLVLIRRRESSIFPFGFSERKYVWSMPINSAGDNISATVTSFNSNGFSLGSESWVNCSGGNFVHILSENVLDFLTWFNIPAMVQEDATVSHNLGGVPGVVIVKNLDTTSSSNWQTHLLLEVLIPTFH